MVLVDTSVWSMTFRRKPETLDIAQEKARLALAGLVAANDAALLGAVRQEMLSGLRERAQYDRLRELLRAFPDVPLEKEDYEEAAQVCNTCRSRGVAGNSVDFLICAAAARRDWQILTLDRDFLGYALCLPLRLHPSGVS